MKEWITALIAFLGFALFAALVIFTPLFYAAGGYFTGWILVHVFQFAGAWVSDGAKALGLPFEQALLPVVGAFLGFTGSFFKAHQSNTNKT